MLAEYPWEGHPLENYFCGGKIPEGAFAHWRAGRKAWTEVRDSYTGGGASYKVSFTQDAEEFKGEVLFLASECNKVTGIELQEKQIDFFPKARLEVIEGAGHTFFIEKPKEALAVIRAYLR